MLKCCQCFVLLQFLFKSKVCIFKLIIKKKRNFTLDGWFSFFLRVAVLLEKDLFYERLKFTWMVLRRGIVSCKSKLFTQFSKDWNGSLWSLRREEVADHSADWHFNSLLHGDVLLQLLFSLFYICRAWGGFIVIPIPSAFKTLKLAGLIVWLSFITIIWSICFIRMGVPYRRFLTWSSASSKISKVMYPSV